MKHFLILSWFVLLLTESYAQIPVELKGVLTSFQYCEPCSYQLLIKQFDFQGIFQEEQSLSFHKQKDLFKMEHSEFTYVQQGLNVVVFMHNIKSVQHKSYKKSELPKKDTYINWMTILESGIGKWLPTVKDAAGRFKVTVVFSNYEYQKIDFIYDKQKTLKEVILVTSDWNHNFGKWQKGSTIHIFYNNYGALGSKELLKFSSFCVLKNGKMISSPKFSSYKIIQG